MTNSSVGQKSQLREHHHTLRRSLQEKEWSEISSKIISRLTSTEEFEAAGFVHTYVSIAKNREVNTFDFIQTCFEAGKQVIVPRMAQNGKLTHHKITSTKLLSKNNSGVWEPSAENQVDLPDHLLVVVPMVSADFNRNRLGYGKGYYDRFLTGINASKIGLCFNFNLSWKPLPTEPFDIKMDKVISDQFII